MKKLLTIAMLLSLSVNSYAFKLLELHEIPESTYFKFGTGMNTIKDIKLKTAEYSGIDSLANAFPVVEVGFGVKISDSTRIEMVLDSYFVFTTREKSIDINNVAYNIERRTNINALMINLYQDLFTIQRFTPFAGVGIGINQLKDKTTGNKIVEDTKLLLDDVSSIGTHKFVYNLITGLDVQIYDYVNLDISYHYFNLGTNKPKLVDGVHNIRKRAYCVHNITTGIRIAL